VGRESQTKSQHPKATVLSCSDSRVPPELVFDQTLGDLFVVRAAGNIAGPFIECLPFRDDSIVAIECDAVLEHVRRPSNAIFEFARVLPRWIPTRGGSFLSSFPRVPQRLSALDD
jgi:SAM-dependent methyltransferase